jgi:hypothetical protein
MSVQNNTSISAPQLKKINVLLNKLNIRAYKEPLVASYTKNRTVSIKEMYFEEARAFIQYLVQQDPDETKRSLILSLGYRCGLLYGESPEDKKMNIAKVNKFLLERGAVKKELHKLNTEELIKVHRQFEAMVRNNHNHSAEKMVKQLLKDVGLKVEK